MPGWPGAGVAGGGVLGDRTAHAGGFRRPLVHRARAFGVAEVADLHRHVRQVQLHRGIPAVAALADHGLAAVIHGDEDGVRDAVRGDEVLEVRPALALAVGVLARPLAPGAMQVRDRRGGDQAPLGAGDVGRVAGAALIVLDAELVLAGLQSGLVRAACGPASGSLRVLGAPPSRMRCRRACSWAWVIAASASAWLSCSASRTPGSPASSCACFRRPNMAAGGGREPGTRSGHHGRSNGREWCSRHGPCHR